MIFSRYPTGGPQYIQRLDLLSDGSDSRLADDQLIDTGGGAIIAVDPKDVTGGGSSGTTATSAQKIEEFVAEGGGALAVPYGRHLIAGNLLVHKFIAGTPNQSFVIVGLGEGQGNGGEHGEWEEAEAVFYAGDPLSVSPDASTEGYRFHAGYISTAVGSGNQPVDAFLSAGLAYSGTAIIAVKIPEAFVDVEDRPDKLRGIYKCRKTYDFDSSGQQIGYGYSTNPARVAADRVLAYFEHKYPNNPTLARQLFAEKIDWASWRTWADFNEEEISWDDGTTVRSIPRFECHIVFTADAILADALDQICASCGAWWQDDGGRITFIPPIDSNPVHHFTESNIVEGSLSIDPRDLRDRANYFIAQFRDQDDEFLGQASVEVRRTSLIAQVGEIKSTRSLPGMNQSQAARLLERIARIEADNPNIISLTGLADSMIVLPGDFATITHPRIERPYQRCLVLSTLLTSAENGADLCQITLQQIDDALYSDTSHAPRQEALTP